MEENKKNDYKDKLGTIIGIIVGVVFISIMFVYIFDPSDNTSSSKYDLELTNVELTSEYNEYLGYSTKITGTAKNITNKNLSYAQIEFSIYDENGNNLGTALANINNLAKGDTWQFEATLIDFPSSKPTSYKLADITTW